MDNGILKKRLNTFKTSKGTISKVSDEVIMELLRAWESWPGTSADLYRDLGLSKMQMVTLLKKGKKLVKNGVFVDSEFKEVKVETPTTVDDSCRAPITMKWDKGKVIRFSQVDQLVDFLNIMEKQKVA